MLIAMLGDDDDTSHNYCTCLPCVLSRLWLQGALRVSLLPVGMGAYQYFTAAPPPPPLTER